MAINKGNTGRAIAVLLTLLYHPLQAQHKFVRYNVDEGLSQSSVYSIFQDSKGFMWFGTGDGINRFDGYKFEVHKSEPDSKGGLSNSFSTQQVVEDKEGNLWFGTRSGGMNKYITKENRFEHIRLFDVAFKNTFDCELVGFDSHNNLWFFNSTNVIGYYNPQTGAVQMTDLPDKIKYKGEGGPNRMGILHNDTIYFISNWVLAAYSVSTGKYDYFLEDDIKKTGSAYTISLCYDRKHDLMWVGTERGVMQFNICTKQKKWINLKALHPSPVVSVMAVDDYGKIWIGTTKSGLLCYNYKNHSLASFTYNVNDAQSLSFDIIRTLYIDRSHNLWVGTDGGGVNKLDLKPPGFSLYAENIFTKCFYEDEHKNIWIGTHENGIYQINQQNGKQHQILRNTKFGNIVSCITKDVYGHLMIGSNNGLDYYENGKFTEIPFSEGPNKVESNNLAHDIFNTREGTTLVATRLGLLEGRYYRGKMDSLRPVGNLHTLLLRIYQTADGRIWVGSQGNSDQFVFRYINGKLVLTEKIFRQCSVHAFYEDRKKNILWMASEAGLIRYDLAKNTHRFITTKNGMADNYLYGVLPDESGRLWLSSNKGLICYNPETGECRNYDVTDGLQSNEFNTGAFFKSSSGQLFFGGINGFNAFFPEQIQNNSFTPLVVLTSLKINDGTVPPYLMNSGSIRLPYDSSTVSFEFTGMEFTNQGKNKYRYRLEGWDNEWVEAGTERFARYSNLPSGHYTFKVQACNNDQVWSTKTSLIELDITPPYWKQWWFVALAVLAAIALVILSVKQFITRRLKEKLRELEKQQAVQKERERISKDMHDDLGSGLSRIAIQSELLKHKLKQNENAEQQAEKIVSASRELVDNLGEIVWAMNPKHDSMQSLMAYLREFTTDLFEDSDTRCVFVFPEQVTDMQIPSEVRRNIYLILKEALNNTFKYAQANEVVLEMKVDSDAVTFTARDNGKGFDTENTRQFGNGLNNMYRRAQAIQAKLDISSGAGKGTQVRMTVKI